MKKIVHNYGWSLSSTRPASWNRTLSICFSLYSLLELSPFAVKVMFWSCVNQSDYKKFYIQFWLWPGLRTVRISKSKRNSTTRAGNNKDGSFADSCGLIILCLHLNIWCNILTASFMHWSIERVHVETSIPGLSWISLFSNLYVQTSHHE